MPLSWEGEGLGDVHSSPSIIGMSKSRRLRLVGHVARMGERDTYKFLVG
jgi:hypothetical protein